MSESYYNSVLMPLDRIRSAMTGMSKTHKKIAEYLLSNYESAAFLTSIVLARNCGVSESSVIRFSMMLGYSGFTEIANQSRTISRQKSRGALRHDT